MGCIPDCGVRKPRLSAAESQGKSCCGNLERANLAIVGERGGGEKGAARTLRDRRLELLGAETEGGNGRR